MFIHCLPRVGSTWLAYKFADRPEVAFRFEPFHEDLIAGTHAELQRKFERLRFGRSLRHPCRAEHYHKDYAFRPEGGVALFQKRFCYQHYYMDADERDEQLRAYLASLFEQPSPPRGRIVVKCTRSALRALWLSRQFSGTHIYAFRSPRLMENSYFSFRGYSNPYIRDFALIVGQNARHRLFAELARWSGLEEFVATTLEQEYIHYRSALLRQRGVRYDRQYHFECLCFFWAVALALATRYADLIIDMDALADRRIQKHTEAEICSRTGMTVDLSDYRVNEARVRRVFSRHRMVVSDGMVDVIRGALSLIGADWDRVLDAELTDHAQRAVEFLEYRAVADRTPPRSDLNLPRGAARGIPCSDAGELFCWGEPGRR